MTSLYDPTLDHRHVDLSLDPYVRGVDLNTAVFNPNHVNSWYVVDEQGGWYQWLEGEATPFPVGEGRVCDADSLADVRRYWGEGDVMRYYPFSVWS